ncbi:hypothetical protein M436DRAFT_65109 [Aureobasidium namibiae CBS 147.97]|uniref:Uncharacterized protein n=1 Tax=Aureobasidium namibiae CBS 147.97 TaxID=1043004 RepID=A0A074WF34_9PEZI|nr:uncharacterized protein M436DRAFT_65109 [Aureobasidium namibiae CBS 147.97]KEQ71618.1 hypothetical protein M436DRAFT_65109 [Aureobasidium namibiae CBS 147.97]
MDIDHFANLPMWLVLEICRALPSGSIVVKQHTLGGPHGSPLAILRRNQEWEAISDWPTQQVSSLEQPFLVWYRHLKVTPEISEKDKGPVLNLWTEQRLYFPRDYMVILRARSREVHLSVCCHQRGTGENIADLLERLSI